MREELQIISSDIRLCIFILINIIAQFSYKVKPICRVKGLVFYS